MAKELKRVGAVVEIISADSFGAKQVEASPELTFALLGEGLVDVITTDFSGGYHDPILLVLQKAIDERLITLPQAIHLATGSPAKSFLVWPQIEDLSSPAEWLICALYR